jgi:hypothetical protein
VLGLPNAALGALGPSPFRPLRSERRPPSLRLVLDRIPAATATHREIPIVFKPALNLVWAFLGIHKGLRAEGHNVFLYQHVDRPEAGIPIDFGRSHGASSRKARFAAWRRRRVRRRC